MRYEIRLSGAGGQGLILAGVILAEAASIYDGRYVCQSQSYGPEARGGACKSEIIISDEEIDYPKVTRPDLLLAMNQRSCDLYFFDLKQDGILIVDGTFVKQLPTTRAISIPFTKIAKERIGNEVAANMVALGAIVTITKVVSLNSLETAMLNRVPKGTEKLNKAAMEIGIEVAKDYLLQEREVKTSYASPSDE